MAAILQASSTGTSSVTLIASDHVPAAVADGDPVDLFIDVNGRQVITQKVERGTQTSVAVTTGAVTILATNHARLGATIHNDSTEVMYVLLSDVDCTTDVYTTSLLADGYYELPYGYTGPVSATWYAPSSGFARVTELT